MHVSIHEAPYHTSTSRQRQNWIQMGIPYFNGEIQKLWEIYGMPTSNKCVPINKYEEVSERSRFIRHPITTLSEKAPSKINTVGGIWMDGIKTDKNNEKAVHMHIRVLENKRKFAYPLFEEFMKSGRIKGYHIYTGWGERSPENDPTSFLENNGFEITKNEWGNSAILKTY